MSRKSVHGWNLILAAVSLLVASDGCHSLPPLPGSAQAGPPTTSDRADYDDDDEHSGWLFRGITGNKRQQPPSGSSRGVVPASAAETLPPATSSASGTVLPPAGADWEIEEDEDAGFQWSDLDPSNVVKNIKEMTGYGPNEGIARTLYREGEALFREKRYQEAAGKFKSAAGRWPDSPLEEDALFMLGESRFFADEYPKAQDAYDKLLKKYDYTHHLDTVTKRLFAIGRYWEQLATAGLSVPIGINVTDSSRPTLDTFGHALKAYQSAQEYDPTGPLADDSVMARANAHFLKGRYEDAAYHYDLIRTEYANSEHQVKAHLLALESRQLIYQGPYYDSTPLEEAGQIADQTLAQFGSELGDERTRVVEARNRVSELQAERDWAVAQYYEKKKYYGAARYYYEAIIDDYPQTVAAGKARQRLEEIKDLPAEPPNRFKWLTNVFESNR